MGLSHSPKIVTDRLSLFLDAANRKSYPGSGSTWFDISNNAINGTLVGNTVYNNNNRGSFFFDASGDYIQLPANSLSFGTSTFTIEAWVKPNAISGINMIYASQSSNLSGHIACGHYTPGGFGTGFFLGDFNGSVRRITSFGTVATANRSYHVVFLKNASNEYVVYVNTVPSTTNTTSTLSLASADPRIGINPDALGGSEIWSGEMSVFKIYNRALSVAEIQQNFSALRGRFGI